ncbi:MAG: zf-HC2 domain-containing protein [Pyrinomonadaceae bacterium]
MNCDECKDLIGAFMDNELDESRAVGVRMHLAVCSECAFVCEDLSSILDVCSTESVDEIVPPNSQAMWCRINNIIESEAKAKAAPPPEPEPQKGRFWQLSFMQLATAVVCVGLISSLLTIVAIRNYTQPPTDDFTTRSKATQTTFEKVLSKVGLMDTPQQARESRLKEQQAAIEYWNARVLTRREQWNRTTRDAFDRNLQVINESVFEYTTILQQDPDDELSGEMLDAVMTDKMNLLRDFADF